MLHLRGLAHFLNKSIYNKQDLKEILLETRICRECTQQDILVNFPLAGEIKGKKYYRHLCGCCYSKQKHKERRNRMKKFKEFKKTLRCSRCGYADYRALQFHHINEEKDGNISEMAQQNSWDVIMNEVNKCEVLCANCHQIEHYSERGIV